MFFNIDFIDNPVIADTQTARGKPRSCCSGFPNRIGSAVSCQFNGRLHPLRYGLVEKRDIILDGLDGHTKRSSYCLPVFSSAQLPEFIVRDRRTVSSLRLSATSQAEIDILLHFKGVAN